MKNRIYLSSPASSGHELKFLKSALDQNSLSLFGSQADQFNDLISSFTESKFNLLLNSGTAALQLALQCIGIRNGDAVICSSMTYVASANPITYLGAKPIFIDSEKDTWNMDPNIFEDAIKKLEARNLRAKAIIPVHLYGMPAKMNEIKEVAVKYEIPIIEDAAEALGSNYLDNPCGSLGDMAILSFNGNKIITTSGGGALLSDDEAYIAKAKFLATQARDDAPHYQHTEIGYNYRMGNINAALGLGQMEVLDERVRRKREIFNFYKNALIDFEEIQFQPEPEGHFSNRWLTTITTKSFEQREAIRLDLEKENIESRPLWKPMHMQPVFKEATYYGANIAEDLFNCGLCLPSGTAMTDGDLERVVEIVKYALIPS